MLNILWCLKAFGVGAFEKEDDDIYTTEDVSRYDFFLESTSESKKRRLKEKHEMQVMWSWSELIK